MDKKEFYEKSEKIINETIETVKKYAKVVAEKTGEAAHVTRLLIQKATLEHQMAKAFSQLGSQIYQKSVRQGETVEMGAPEIQKVLEEIKKLDTELGQVEAVLEKERKVKAVKEAKLKAVRKRTTKSS
jgi:anion-transporting  ArsA/GET3 family ATPase